jgi:hypothetical protein
MLPEARFGVVILTSQNGSGLPGALLHRVFDHQLGGLMKDWAGDGLKRLEAQRARAAEAQKKAESGRLAGTKPSLPLSAYAGTYADSLYGAVVITEAAGKLSLTFGPNWKSELEHYHLESFRARFDTPVLPPVPVTFRIGAAGTVESVLLDMAGTAEFRRVPEPRR